MSAPRQPMMYLEEVEPIAPTAATYIDYSVTNSILSGLLVAVLAGWAMVVFNRLWQTTLRERAQEAIDHAASRGLALQPAGLRARLVARGAIGSEQVQVEWRGGWRGPHVLLTRGDERSLLPFAADAGAIDALLAAPSTEPPESQPPQA